MNVDLNKAKKTTFGSTKSRKKEILERYRQKFTTLKEEIESQQQSLQLKYQELGRLQNEISQKKGIRSRINPQINKLNEVKLNLPNFLIIGVQKGGTTWLHENLKQHPHIFLPPGRKELEFFSYYQKKTEESGISRYLEKFNRFEEIIKKEKPRAIGEATPSYYWSIEPARKWTNAPQHFNHQIPDSVFNLLGKKIKLIVCLRDPVERAISAYFHHIKRGRISYKSQRIFDVGHLYGIIDMGFYAQHLDPWLKKFPLDNFKFLIYEKDIKQNKQQTIEDICNFIGVDSKLFPQSANLDQYHNRGLRYSLGEDGAFLVTPDDNERINLINKDELKELRKIYYEDYISLQKILNLDLSEYWKFN